MDWYLYLFQASTVDEPDAICFTERCQAEIDAIQRGESLFHDITSNFTAYRIWRVTALGDVERVTDWRFRPEGLVRDENVVYATQIARRAADRLESLTRDMDILRSEIAVYKSQIESLKASQSANQELLRELDLLRNEVATYRECGIIRMQTLAALIADQAKEIENIDAGEKARR